MTEPTQGSPKDRNWPKDEFGRSEVSAQLGLIWVWIAIAFIAIIASIPLWLHNIASRARSRVVAYCAQDQVYAEPIFRNFEEQTGIKVKAVYDSEAVKTVG